jgi:cellulose synthase/poly-beta-1,6-N-acetylglucosamine synthase-like glycosyltransferase
MPKKTIKGSQEKAISSQFLVFDMYVHIQYILHIYTYIYYIHIQYFCRFDTTHSVNYLTPQFAKIVWLL